MSHNLSEMLDGVFDSQRKIEENEIPSNEFKAVYSKGLKYGMLIATAASMIVNLLLVFLHKQVDIGVCLCIFLLFPLLLLPTFFSYKCYIDRVSMKEEYFILCFKVKKEVFWKDIAYKLIKRDKTRNELSTIRFYDSERKKLISFDMTVVGFGKIIRMSKKIPKLK
ncbi:MAG: hypothetical protein IIW88_05340 [Clostridia bacterium]|nr:hypothetical protein [Clostridia bacterium]